MKIYELSGLEDGSQFFTTKAAAIKDAEFYGDDSLTVDEVEIGRLTKATACAMANGKGYAISRRQIWPPAVKEERGRE